MPWRLRFTVHLPQTFRCATSKTTAKKVSGRLWKRKPVNIWNWLWLLVLFPCICCGDHVFNPCKVGALRKGFDVPLSGDKKIPRQPWKELHNSPKTHSQSDRVSTSFSTTPQEIGLESPNPFRSFTKQSRSLVGAGPIKADALEIRSGLTRISQPI